MTDTRTLDLDALHLKVGAHDPDGEFCVMEAVAYVAGEPWSSAPACASPVIGAFLRSWNDDLGDESRQDLKRYIRRLVGSHGTAEEENARAWMAVDWLVRTYTPIWLRLAGLGEQAERLAGLPDFRAGMDVPSIRPAIAAVRAAARAAAWDPAWAAAWDAARAGARDAARAAAADAAADAARDAAARDAAGVAAADPAWAAAWDAARDAARAAAWAAAWDAAARDAAGVAARAAAADAAWAVLNPAVTELQAAAHRLVDRMLAVTEAGPV